jgi:hypothetical protein
MSPSIHPATRRGASRTNYRRDDEVHMALLKRKRIGVTDAMEVVTRFINACNRHDADGVSSCLHPDFDSIQPMYPTRNFRGADQVRRNWQAIFDAEPGFRLTVLRSASAEDTVWLELHGAGRDAEVAGIFIMGIVGDRIRWARIYSALVEPVPAGVGEPPPPLQEVPRTDDRAPDDGEMVESELIAPVLDMERSTRRRRRRRAEADAAAAAGDETGSGSDEADAGDDVADELEPAPEATGAIKDAPAEEVEPVTVVEVVQAPPADEGDLDAVAVADDELEAVALVEAGVEPVAVIETDADAATATVGTDAQTVTVVETDEETGTAVDTDHESATVVEPAPAPAFEEGLDTEAVPVIVWDAPDAEAALPEENAPPDDPRPDEPPPDESSRRRFGKRR